MALAVIDTELRAWVDARLAAAGRERTGELALFRERAWATIYSTPTDAGTVWLKVSPPATAFEPRLYELLAELVPDRILVPLGTDPERGRLLLPDGGTSLGDRYDDGDDDDDNDNAVATALATALPAYAQLQVSLAPHVERILACGVQDMRPDALPQRFDEALEAAAPYVSARGSAAERADFDRLPALRDTYVEWCAQLSASEVAMSIDHNDLHAGNVLDGPRFYDWGDAVVAHPFASLLLIDLNFPGADTIMTPYLAEFGDAEALRPVAHLAMRVGNVARALVWHRAVAHDPAHERANAPLYFLRRLLRAGTPTPLP